MSEYELNLNYDIEPVKAPSWSTVRSAQDLLAHLKRKGLVIEKTSGMEGADNCIYLPDKTSFNWKSRKGQVRVNCKTNAKLVIEQKTSFIMIANGVGDTIRPYSLLLESEVDLDAVIEALRYIEGNATK